MNEKLEELIYSFEDLEINEPVKVKMNKESSVKDEIRENSSMPSTSYVPTRSGKTTRIRPEQAASEYTYSLNGKYIPNRHLLPSTGTGLKLLNLDCKLDAPKTLNQQGQDIGLYFLTDKSSNFTNEEKYKILVTSLDGNIRNWFLGISYASRNTIRINVMRHLDTSLTEGITAFINYIADEFMGYDWNNRRDVSRKVEKQNALKALNQLQICKMCDINSYICEFEEYYYQYYDSNEDMTKIAEMLYQKLPGIWSSYFMNQFSKNATAEGYSNTLGARIFFLKEKLVDL